MPQQQHINTIASAAVNRKLHTLSSENIMDLRLQTTLQEAENTVVNVATHTLNMANFHISTGSTTVHNKNTIITTNGMKQQKSPSCQFLRIDTTRNSGKGKRENGSIIPMTLAVSLTLPQELSSRLDNTNVILIDTRSFMSFNKKHISGALNVNCTNPCFRRRLAKGKTTVGDLITSEDGKALFRSRSGKDVVVYDEDSQEIDNLPANHPTVLVLKSLNKEGTRASLLRGNYCILLFVCNHLFQRCIINFI